MWIGNLWLILSLLSCGVEQYDEHHYNYGEKITVKDLCNMHRGRTVRITHDYLIEGNVVATDKLNEVSGLIVIADDTGGVGVRVRSRDTEALAPLKSRVVLRCVGLALGRSNGRYVLGKYPTEGYVVDQIAASEVSLHLIPADDDVMLAPHYVTIADVAALPTYSYVGVMDVAVVDEEQGMSWGDIESLNGEHYDTIRHITDGCDTLPLLVDARCDYASDILPTGCCTLYGIIDCDSLGRVALRVTNRYAESKR